MDQPRTAGAQLQHGQTRLRVTTQCRQRNNARQSSPAPQELRCFVLRRNKAWELGVAVDLLLDGKDRTASSSELASSGHDDASCQGRQRSKQTPKSANGFQCGNYKKHEGIDDKLEPLLCLDPDLKAGALGQGEKDKEKLGNEHQQVVVLEWNLYIDIAVHKGSGPPTRPPFGVSANAGVEQPRMRDKGAVPARVTGIHHAPQGFISPRQETSTVHIIPLRTDPAPDGIVCLS
eukprot:scaffold763_cov402-Prasinococcus_capsulatus_cf.AAC.14